MHFFLLLSSNMEKLDEAKPVERTKWPGLMFWILTVFLAAAGIGLGVIIGYFTAPTGSECPTSTTADPSAGTPTNVIDRINAANIEENLRYVLLFIWRGGLGLNDALMDPVVQGGVG